MDKILHILNGDSAVTPFKESGINGEYVVWREVLSEGPINHAFGSDGFWEERESYMSNAFELGHNEYSSRVKEPFEEAINRISSFNEVCLWFEYDLFCQINMIGLIDYIGRIKSPELQLTLVCAGEIEGEVKLYGLGELNADHYQTLFSSRIKLGTRETDYASEVFNTYSDRDAEGLYNYVLMPFNEFKYLNSALEAHMRRFPYSDSGLTEIETKIISLIESGVKEERKIIRELLKWQKYYGFGDLQYAMILENMKPLFVDFDKLQLHQNLSFEKVEELMDRKAQLGGAWLKDWVYDINEKTLTSRSQRSIDL